jgi:D-alanine-D-alanine ligase
MNKKSVLLLFGGESSEHDVSLASARNVYEAINKEKFDTALCYIDREGKWWLVESIDQLDMQKASELIARLGSKRFIISSTNKEITPDVILPILHGKNGEDGTAQGLAQLMHIPIVGCDVEASSVCMNKVIAKELLRAAGIPIVPYELHYSFDLAPDFTELTEKLGAPLFVKPSRTGSSVGVSKVRTVEEFNATLETAHRYDDLVLIEKAISARELEVAVLGNNPHHKASVVGEIKPGDEFYSYNAKYASSSTSSVEIPAVISTEQSDKIRALAYDAYKILGCKGLSRIDFFLDENEKLYINEVNTMPGFTNISMYPKLWMHEGLTYPQLIESLLSLALGDIVES